MTLRAVDNRIDDEAALYDRWCPNGNLDELIPTIARDQNAVRSIEACVRRRQTRHELILGDARQMDTLPDASVHLVLTSPPYWTLKRYNDSEGQLGHVQDYDHFVAALDAVWANCYRLLVPGG